MSCDKRLNKEFSEKVISRFGLFQPDEWGTSRFSIILESNKPDQFYKKRYVLVNGKTGFYEICLYINYEYPFKAPDVEIAPGIIDKFSQINLQNNGLNAGTYGRQTNKYSRWCSVCLKNSRIETSIIKRAWFFTLILYKEVAKVWHICPDKDVCLCCQSIICGKNWSPAYTMYDVCNEYILRKTFYIFTSKLIQKRIGSLFQNLFSNERWDIPEDIILHILSFCHSNKNITNSFLQGIYRGVA